MKTSVKPLTLLCISLVIGAVGCSEQQAETPQKTVETPQKVVETTPQTPQVTQVSAVSRGEKLYKRCVTCHTLAEGERHKVGPNLHGLYGATAGTKEGYAYSKAMTASEIVWTDETLDAYIENPSKYVPKGKMSYVGLRKPEDREALLAFLKEATQ